MTSPQDAPVLAYLGLGSNLGDRKANIEEALTRLEQYGIKVVARSTMYETAPAYVLDQPDFINACAGIEYTGSAKDLLDTLLRIETAMGRVRVAAKGPRIIDLDLLLFGDTVIHGPNLTVPHPEMAERRFVLEPLAEIAGHVIHPVEKISIAQMLAELPHASSGAA